VTGHHAPAPMMSGRLESLKFPNSRRSRSRDGESPHW
jgi:hypothetical protein